MRALIRRSAVALLLAAGTTLGAAVGGGSPASAVQCQEPGDVIRPVPWAQQALLPQRAFPLATGAGVVVAVLDSGVDAVHPQLAGQVSTGRDYLYSKNGPGNRDCVGHGTAVGSIIAARQVDGTGFHGVAPGARLLPMTVSERRADGDRASGAAVSPNEFAAVVRDSVQRGAKVINISAVFTTDHPAVRAAIRNAVEADVVVVAAVGNSAEDGNPTPYPAAYPDVLGVGAVDQQGRVLPQSGRGAFVDLVAPGDGITAATPRRGHATWRGTSFAAPFVSGAAALVRQYHPKLTAREVTQRLTATASPSPGGARSDSYGFGMVDPYRAVAERFVQAVPTVAPTPVEPVLDPAVVAREAERRRLATAALTVGGTGAGLALVVGLVAIARRIGRRGRWRPTRATRMPTPTLAQLGPPVGLLDDVTSGDRE
ncbi:type VII secretion-associated serine protease mycosin [Micromonospora sp. DT31]|uniref:type VII secretion-associated serine protease mycosin n=1 Tax=Micromonospora sp. DT31 TaxID=3393434 RepID=UPI003CE939A6